MPRTNHKQQATPFPFLYAVPKPGGAPAVAAALPDAPTVLNTVGLVMQKGLEFGAAWIALWTALATPAAYAHSED